MAATHTNPFYSSFFRPWTLWENPITRAPKDFANCLPLDSVTKAVRVVADIPFVKPLWDNAPARISASVVRLGYSNLFTRFAYGMAERIFNSTAVLRSLSDIDSLTKTVTLAVSISGLWLGTKHPFIASLELGNKALGGFIFAKHVIPLTNKSYMEAFDKQGNLVPGKICKTAALIGFQFAHFCQTHEFMKKTGLFDILSEVPVVGHIGKACLKMELGSLKNPAVVIGAIFATLAVGEWALVKINDSWSKPEGTLWKAITSFTCKPDEEVDQVANGVNNATKAYIVAILAKWAKAVQPYARISGDLLGATNLFKGAGYEEKKDADSLPQRVRLATIYNNPSIAAGRAEIVKLRKEDLKTHKCVRA